MYLVLFSYLTKSFLKSIGLVALVIVSTFFIADFLELLRATSHSSAKISALLSITLAKIPFIFQETYPFILFIAAIYSFFHLSKRNEYTIIKTSGISIWQFLLPYLITGLVIGIFTITILNPLSAKLLNNSKKLKQKIISKNKENSVALLDSGFWFIDQTADENMNVIIHSDGLLISGDKVMMMRPSFIYADKQYHFLKDIKAAEAHLEKGVWKLRGDISEYVPRKQTIKHLAYSVETKISIEELKNSFVKPKYISIWDLPYFIATLQSSGHSAKQYVAFMYKMLSTPFITIAMLFMAAVFTLKPIRIFKGSKIIICSLATVFTAYFSIEIAFAAGMNSNLPQVFTAAALILITNFIGVLSLKYSE